MAHTIYKYNLKITDSQILVMPQKAKILSVQDQNGALCLWAIVDTYNETRPYVIEIYGTGHPFPYETRIHISTVQMNGLVWHIFLNPLTK